MTPEPPIALITLWSSTFNQIFQTYSGITFAFRVYVWLKVENPHALKEKLTLSVTLSGIIKEYLVQISHFWLKRWSLIWFVWNWRLSHCFIFCHPQRSGWVFVVRNYFLTIEPCRYFKPSVDFSDMQILTRTIWAVWKLDIHRFNRRKQGG